MGAFLAIRLSALGPKSNSIGLTSQITVSRREGDWTTDGMIEEVTSIAGEESLQELHKAIEEDKLESTMRRCTIC